MPSPARTLSPHERRLVAVRALVSPDAVRRVLAGERVRPMTTERITRALGELEREGVLAPGTR